MGKRGKRKGGSQKKRPGYSQKKSGRGGGTARTLTSSSVRKTMVKKIKEKCKRKKNDGSPMFEPTLGRGETFGCRQILYFRQGGGKVRWEKGTKKK